MEQAPGMRGRLAALNPFELLRRRQQRRDELERNNRFVDQRKLFEEMRREISQGRLAAGFSIGERLLDMKPFAEVYELLINLLDRNAKGLYLYDLLEQLETEPPAGDLPWRQYLRFVLLDRVDRRQEAFVFSEVLTQLPDRYGWMRYDRANLLMNWHSRYDDARREFDATLRSAPAFWKAAAWSAETLLCQGREEEAFAAMDRCIAEIPRHGVPTDQEMALVWRGELHLWMGRYERALADLDGPANRAMHLALGWRGACFLLLGDPQKALKDLDAAVLPHLTDAEALTWRGEGHARLKQWEPALSNLNRAIEVTLHPPARLWAVLARALVRDRMGDEGGFWADFDQIPIRFIQYYQWKLKAEVQRNREVAVQILEAMQASARGIRRAESYLIPLWLGR